MSKTVDERVVEMRFDNSQFEKNVSNSVSTLDKLKRSLNLSGAAKGLNDVGNAAKNVKMDGLGSSIETVRAKFSALQVVGVTALANIANSAVNAGKRIVNALTLEPVMSGFQEYETQINAVQTILANTKSKGSTLNDVNKALDELNLYADKTIYNFTEMTRNIGTFTAAGIDLKTSVSAIQGIANLAAVSGSTSQQASTAMYQLSQALAAGTVKLMDWNSVVNAGMGGEVFQNALKKTSEELKTGAEAAIKAKGSFRESLQTGWLTSEVLTETLKKFTTSGANEYVAEYTGLSKDAVEAALKDAKAKYGEADAIKYASKALAEKSGKNADEIASVLEMANTAEDAATKVKTFSQLWDTLKEAAQSGWTQSWEIIVGDFEEAKEMLTQVSDTIGAIIQKSSDARNALLQGWKDQGGRDDLLQGFKNIFEGISSIVKPIKEAFSEVFRSLTSNDLVNVTKRFRDFTQGLILTEEAAGKVKRAFKGVFSIFDIVRKVILSVGNAIAKLLGSEGVSSLGDMVLNAAASLGDFFTSLNEGFDTAGFSGILSKIASGISSFLSSAVEHIGSFGDIFSSVGDVVTKVCGKIWEAVKTVFGWISDHVSVGDIFAGLAGGGIFVAGKKIASFLDNIIEVVKGLFGKGNGLSEIKGKFADILDSVHDSLSAFATGIKISSLVSIAVAVGILSASLKTISEVDAAGIAKSLLAIGAMMGMLSGTLALMTKTLGAFGSKGLVKAGISLMMVAKAIDILANAMEKISKLSSSELTKGLIGVGVGLTQLAIGLRIIGKTKISLRTSVAILALAESCKMLADALKKFSGMSWDEIGRGLTAMGAALAEFVIAISVLNKFGGGKSLLGSLGILIVVQSLSKMAEGLKKFAGMSWDEIKRGLSAMGGALGELTIALSVLGKIAGFSSIFAAGAILIVVQGLSDLADALKDFGLMSWDEIGRGLSGMGGALGEVSLVTGLLGKLAGFSGIFGAGSILIVIQGLSDLADALQKFGWMSWDEIGRGLSGMGGALTEVATVTGLLGTLAGFSSIFASGAILIVIQGLSDLAEALQKFGLMTWDEIGRGLSGMGGALAEIGIITGALGKLAGFSSIFASGSILIVIQGLGDLADGFKRFAGMSWEEIARGLVGMGGALTEVAAITGILGSLAGLPALLGSGAILLAVQGLGDLADALKKFGEMSWEEIGKGLSAMGGALGELALGGVLNTLSILGSLSISTVAEPLGVLADSVKKWADVTIPEGLGGKLAALAGAVTAFTFSGIGAGSLYLAAPAVGTLADSVKKWTGVTVPDGLGEKMGILAKGIEKFTLGGLGAGALSTAAPGVGVMADSIKKWSGVTIPDGLEEGLTQIANGVKAFSWAFMGGFSIGTIVEPLGSLSETIKKWNGVSIPENLESGLTSLANGIKAFSWAFMGGWSLSAITGPLGDLAGSVKKWNGINVPENLESGLDSLASGIKAFSWAFVGGWSLGTITGPLGNLAGSVMKWNGVSVPSGLGDKLKSLAGGVKAFSGITDISTAASGMSTITTAVKNIAGVDFNSISTGLNTLTDSIKNFATIDSVSASISTFGTDLVNGILTPLKNATSQFSEVGSTLAESLTKGFNARKAEITNSVSKAMEVAVKTVNSKKSTFTTAGSNLAEGLASGVTSKTSRISTAFTSALRSAASSARAQRSNFYSAGAYVAEGFANGISSNAFRAQASAAAMAQKALAAAKAALGIASPSKEAYKMGNFYGLGFVNALDDYGSKVYKASERMAGYANDGMSEAIKSIRSNIGDNVDVQPTIRPVLDLSEIKTGANAISSMLDQNRSIGVSTNISAVSTMMNRRNQNGVNAGVISAIDKIHKDLNGLERPSYNINGITYDSGSEVAEAIQTLVRAAKIERRV